MEGCRRLTWARPVFAHACKLGLDRRPSVCETTFDKFAELIPSGFGIGIRRNGRGGCLLHPGHPRQCFRSPRINLANASLELGRLASRVVGLDLANLDCPNAQRTRALTIVKAKNRRDEFFAGTHARAVGSAAATFPVFSRFPPSAAGSRRC
jgi:hypothetical protein